MDTNELKRGFDFDVIDIASEAIARKNLTGDEPFDARTKSEKKIEILFQKMEKEGDFPSFSKRIVEINTILNLKYASAKDIAEVIMKDFSLCNKLLKLVNSSLYGYSGRGGVSSVEKAIILLGADRVQQAAASLMLFEQMQQNSHSNELKELSLKTLTSGLIAKGLATEKKLPDSNEFLICSMFYRLGENLMAYYHPERRESILQFAKRNSITFESAFRLFLGVSCQDLGVGIAKQWGLPDNIVCSMQTTKPEKRPSSKLSFSRGQLLGLASSFSNELCDIRFQVMTQQQRESVISKLIRRYRGWYDADLAQIDEVLKAVISHIKQSSSDLNINTAECRVLFDGS